MKLEELEVFLDQNLNRDHPYYGGIRTMIMFRREFLPEGADSSNLGRGWTIDEAYRDLRERTRRQAGIDIGPLDDAYDAPSCDNCGRRKLCLRPGSLGICWRNY